MFITATDIMTIEAIIGYNSIVGVQTEPFGFSLMATVENFNGKKLYYQKSFFHVETGAMKALGKDFLLSDFADRARDSFEKYLNNVFVV